MENIALYKKESDDDDRGKTIFQIDPQIELCMGFVYTFFYSAWNSKTRQFIFSNVLGMHLRMGKMVPSWPRHS